MTTTNSQDRVRDGDRSARIQAEIIKIQARSENHKTVQQQSGAMERSRFGTLLNRQTTAARQPNRNVEARSPALGRSQAAGAGERAAAQSAVAQFAAGVKPSTRRAAPQQAATTPMSPMSSTQARVASQQGKPMTAQYAARSSSAPQTASLAPRSATTSSSAAAAPRTASTQDAMGVAETRRATTAASTGTSNVTSSETARGTASTQNYSAVNGTAGAKGSSPTQGASRQAATSGATGCGPKAGPIGGSAAEVKGLSAKRVGSPEAEVRVAEPQVGTGVEARDGVRGVRSEAIGEKLAVDAEAIEVGGEINIESLPGADVRPLASIQPASQAAANAARDFANSAILNQIVQYAELHRRKDGVYQFQLGLDDERFKRIRVSAHGKRRITLEIDRNEAADQQSVDELVEALEKKNFEIVKLVVR